MTTRIATWGNSLALRLPRTIAAEAELEDGDAVDISLEQGAIVLRPVARRHTIEDLTAGITRHNRHDETDWGGPRGGETW